MTIKDPIYKYGDVVKCARERYSEEDPLTFYDGRIVGLRFVTNEDDADTNEWEYQVLFKTPTYSDEWYTESALIDGISYRWK